MKHEDTVKLIGLIVVAYPNFDKFKDESHIRSTVALWDLMFADDDAGLVSMAVEKHIATSKWPPSIAELRDIMTTVTHPGLIPTDEAWAAVRKLLSQHEHLYSPTDTYLPPLIAQAVDAVGYSALKELSRAAARGQSSKAGLDRVAFVQAYEAALQRAKEEAAMPGRLKARLDKARLHYADGSAEQLLSLEQGYREQQEQYRRLTLGGNLLPEFTCESGDSIILKGGLHEQVRQQARGGRRHSF